MCLYRAQNILHGQKWSLVTSFAEKDTHVQKVHKCSFIHKFHEARIPSKIWGQMHCNDVCSTTSKVIAPQSVSHIVFQVNMGVRSRDQ